MPASASEWSILAPVRRPEPLVFRRKVACINSDGYRPQMRFRQDAGRVSSSRVYRVATALVTTWLRRCARGVDPRFAADRTTAVQFELWERAYVADQRWRPTGAAIGLVLRAAAGGPRDLTWRRAVRSGEFPDMFPPVPLLSPRSRQRLWVPMQFGHVFDQTNGLAESEEAVGLLGLRSGQRLVVPMRAGYVFDQTNGVLASEEAAPSRPRTGSTRPIGTVIRLRTWF